MIKSEIIKNEKEETNLYPYIGKLKDTTDELYVLFSYPKTGTCISSDTPVWKIGDHINHCSECNFEKISNDIIIKLSNK